MVRPGRIKLLISNVLINCMTTNRFGLSRHLPADVALEVRRRSKFGCVLCRCAIYQYEHIDPEFSEAQEHHPDNLCLLCGGCHDRVTRGRIAKQTVKQAYADIQANESVRPPFEELDLSSNSLSIVLGASVFEHSKTLFRINGEDILAITPPQNGSKFPTLNGIFYDLDGNESFRISDNVWEGRPDAWDIEVIGARVVVKARGGEVALAFEISPPSSLQILKLEMFKDNCHISCNPDQLVIGQMHGEMQTSIGLSRFQCDGAEVAISVDSRSDTPPVVTGLRVVGGEGIFLDGTGIVVGAGAAQMMIGELWLRTRPRMRRL